MQFSQLTHMNIFVIWLLDNFPVEPLLNPTYGVGKQYVESHYFLSNFWVFGDQYIGIIQFFQFTYMLAHEYFGDMTFSRFFCETFMEPSVESLGGGGR